MLVTRGAPSGQDFTYQLLFCRFWTGGLKAILDRNNVEYSRKTIKHALQLKEDLEKLNIKRSQSSNVTLDIEAIYPSIQIEHVKRAIEYFLKDASEEDK